MATKLLANLKGEYGTVGLYDATYRAFAGCTLVAASISNNINAPFGRFSSSSALNVNANFGWFVMEIVSPITFLLALSGRPLSSDATIFFSGWSSPQEALSKVQSLSRPTQLLAGLFVLHYINRSTISTLRTPSARSPMHISVPLSAILFNLANGYLLGSWLGGRTQSAGLLTSNTGAVPSTAFQSPLFWLGISLWFIGFVGNIYHDEILYSLRRPNPNGRPVKRYSIPHGGLYEYISFPSYFCEWVEWFGFALACCSTIPIPPTLPATALPTVVAKDVNAFLVYLQNIFFFIWRVAHNNATFIPPPKAENFDSPLWHWATYTTPPWVFLYAELATMTPRAIKGHAWYRQKFGSEFPRNRKVVVPGIF